MTRKPFFWLVCFSLVLTRLLGVHVHSCAGFEGKPHDHEPVHFADAGLLFGEHHADDHADNHESELTALVSIAKAEFGLDDGAALPASDHLAIVAATRMVIRAPRGPPAPAIGPPAYLQPPLRGPPAYL